MDSSNTQTMLKQRAVKALEHEIKSRDKIPDFFMFGPAWNHLLQEIGAFLSLRPKEKSSDKKEEIRMSHVVIITEKLRQDSKAEAKLNLLALKALRDDEVMGEEPEAFILDQETNERATLNEALRARLEPKHIQILLEDYPNACESGGCLDHINHPIHIACAIHPAAVPAILKAAPKCASQLDEKGMTPFEIFLRNKDTSAITPEKFANAVETLCKLTPVSLTKGSFTKHHSIKQRVFTNVLLPRHLEAIMK